MKKLYFLFTFFFLISTTALAGNVLPPTAAISGGMSLCRGDVSPNVTFTGSGGTAPYTFTYTINGLGSATLMSTGDVATLPVSTAITGTYTYSILSVTDSSNATQSLTGISTTFTINSAAITGPASACINGTNVQLTGTAVPSTNPAMWLSSNPAVATVSNTGLVDPISAGTTTITFNGGNGCSATHIFTVGSQITADFTFNDNACSGANVAFTPTLSGGTGPYTYSWNFGDTTPVSTLMNPTHSFTSLGCATEVFNVVLTVTDAVGCTATITKPVTIRQKPHAELQDVNGFNPFSNCDNNPTAGDPSYTLTINNTSTNTSCTTSYVVDWGDGTPTQTITGQLTHTYTSLGSFPLTLTATGTNGCVNTVTYNVANQSNPAGSLGTTGNTIGCAPLSVEFRIGSWELNSPGTQYELAYGDGQTLNLTQADFAALTPGQPYSVIHQYTTSSCPNASSFTAILTVTNLCNSTPYTAGSVQVRVKPIPEFTVPVNGLCSGQPITFPNTTIAGFGPNCNTGANYVWNFGDPAGANNIVTVNNAPAPPAGTHTFSGPGVYTVTLSVTNNCGTEVTTRQVCIDGPLTAGFTLDNNNGCAPFTVAATNTTQNANNTPPSCPVTYEWTVPNALYQTTNCGTGPLWAFASGSSSTDANPQFVFHNSGTYTIRLRVTNSCGTYTSDRQVTVTRPANVTIAAIPDQCFNPAGVTINPVATVTNCGTTAPAYAWSFPDGTPSTSTSATPSVTYATSGTKTFTLVVTNECGPSTTVTRTVVIRPELIVNAGTDVTICPNVGQALNGTASGGSGTGYTYSWSPAAGLSATNIANPVATPTATTTYTLSVTDSSNCTVTDQVVVNVNAIVPGTIATAQTVCTGGDPATLTETVPATAPGTLTYQWQSSPDNTAFTDIAGATNTTYDPPVPTANIYYRRLAISTLNGVECGVPGNAVQISINAVTPAVFAAGDTICEGGNLPAFTATTAPTGSGTLTYLWESSTDNAAFATVGTSATFDPPALTQTTYYRQTVTSTLNGVPCTAVSNTITITVVPPPTITAEPLVTQTLCQGGAVTPLTVTVTGGVGAPPVYMYQWYSNATNSTTGGTLIATATTDTYTPSSATVGTRYYYVVVSTTGAGCSDTSAVAQVVVTPSPTFTTHPVSENLCVGQTPSQLSVAYANGTGTPTYQWYSNTVNNNTTGTPIGGANAATYNPPATTGTVYYYAVITFTTGGCSVITSNVAQVSINVLPSVITAQNATTCSGTAFTVTPADGGGNTIPAGTTYTWTAPTGTGFTGGSAATTGQTNISQTLTNTTNAPVTVQYQVTPSANNCAGTPFTVTVTLNPTPKIPNQAQAICSGDTFSVTLVNNAPTVIVPTGTTYTWSAPTVTPAGVLIGEAAGTNQASISGQLTNTTNTVQTLVYTVTPTSPTGNCAGTPFTVTVTVNPVPQVANQQVQLCSGQAFTFTPVNGGANSIPAGTTYTWTTTPVTGVTGNTNQTTAQPTISQTLTNSGTAAATVTYNVTPVSGTCTGSVFTIEVLVSPTPIINAIASQTKCGGETTDAVTFTSPIAGTVFNWTNNTPSIGLAATGTGDIAGFTATNTTSAPVTATITVTPTLNGCAGIQQTFTITVNPAPAVSFSQPNQTICSGTASVAVNLTSTTPGATITWTAVQPVGITGVATSGTTTIPVQTLTNTTSNAITVTYIATASTTGVSCPGAPMTYTITVNPVPFVGSQQNTAVCSGVAPNFIPTDGGGNNIPVGTTFTWTTTTVAGITGNSNQTTAQPSLNQVLTNTTATAQQVSYNLTPTFNGCVGIPFTVVVTVNPKAAVANAAINICSGTSFTHIPTGTIPTGTTYSWSAPTAPGITGTAPGTGQATIFGTLDNASSTTPQTVVYVVTPLSPQGNCTGNPFNVSVTVNPVFGATGVRSNYNGYQISASGATDGTINVTPTGGTGAYTYVWTGPGITPATAGNQDQANLGEGTYTVTINDGLCNQIVLTFQMAAPLPLVIEENLSSHQNVDCFGDTTGVIEVVITQPSVGPYDYVIRIDNGAGTGAIIESVTDTNALNYVFDNLAANAYLIQVTDANGHTEELQQIIVTQPAQALAITNAVVSNFNGFGISCNGANNGSIDITVAGGNPGYTYQWTSDNGFTATTQDINNLGPGTYTVVVNDMAGLCPATQTFTITEPLPVAVAPVVSDYNGFGISCFNENDGSIVLNTTGGTGIYTYQWTGAGVTAGTQNQSNLMAGTYTVIVTDSNGCALAQQTFTLTQPPAITVTETHTHADCFGANTGAIDVTTGGGVTPYSFSWAGPNGFAAATEDITGIAAGTYTLIVTDGVGCTSTLNVIITQPSQIIITPTTTPISCYQANDATITVAVTGGNGPYTVTWSNLATGTFQGNLAAGTYVITATDASNCSQSISVTIVEAPLFTVNPVVQQISCHGAKDGSITLNFQGGIAPVTLVWNDGSTSGTTRNNLGPGTYTVTITDSKPCTIIRTFTIVEPAAIVLGANVTQPHDCNDAFSGAIDLIPGGGIPPYTIQWTGSATSNSEDLTNITSGNYLVTVTDANGCTASRQFTLTRPDPLTVSVISNVTANCTAGTVNQVNTATGAGGVPPYSFTWSDGVVSGNRGQNMVLNGNGTVIVTVTDSQGCTAQTTFVVDTEQLGQPSFDMDSYASGTYNLFSIMDPIQFTNTSTGDYTAVAWDFGDGSVSDEENPVHTYMREGTYIITQTVTYPYGCVLTNKLTIVIEKGYDVMTPNAFTPNGDGINDTFAPQFRGAKSVELNVYDTWGSMIYYEKGETIKGWDGNLKSTPAENGNYVYKIVVETFYGVLVTFDGPFVLIK